MCAWARHRRNNPARIQTCLLIFEAAIADRIISLSFMRQAVSTMAGLSFDEGIAGMTKRYRRMAGQLPSAHRAFI